METEHAQEPATRHAIVYAGELLPGFDGQAVRAHARELFRLRPQQVERLFCGEPVTVKTGLDFHQALHFERQFRRIGMRVAVHALRPEPVSAPAPADEVTETAVPPEPAPAAVIDPATQILPAEAPATASPSAPEATPVATTSPTAPAADGQAPLHLDFPALSAREQLRLNLTAGLMLCLPLLYLGGIFSLAYLLGMTFLSLAEGEQPAWLLAPMALLGTAGGSLLFLWLEPLFQSPDPGETGITLNATRYPRLHAWLGQLGKLLAVPSPEHVELVLAPHSEVRLRNGLSSYWRQELALFISAQQLAGLKPPQLAGVLGHELARYGQWRVMKLAFLIDAVHTWFMRGVNRPSWIESRLPGGKDGDTAPLVAHLARVLRVLRLPLHGLLRLSELAHRPVKRALCLRADAIAAQLIGSAAYAETLVATAWLQEADELADAKTWQAWELGQLADDRVLLCLRFMRQSSQEGLDAFRRELLTADPDLWNSQPTVGERIQALEMLAEPGRLKRADDLRPHDLPLLCRQLTERHYAAHGVDENDGVRIGSAQLLNLTQSQDEAYAALERYFVGSLRKDRFLALPSLETLQSTDERFKRQRLQDVIDALRQQLPAIGRLYLQYDAALGQVLHYQGLRARLDAGDVDETLDTARIADALDTGNGQLNARRLEIQAMEELQAQRLGWALSLCPDLPPATAPMLACLRGLHRLQADIDSLAQNEYSLELLLATAPRRANARRERVLHVHGEKLENALLKLREALYVVPNPFGPGSLGGMMTWAGISAGGDAASLLAFSRGLRTQLGHYNERIMGQLCRHAEDVENRLELRPLRTRLTQVRA